MCNCIYASCVFGTKLPNVNNIKTQQSKNKERTSCYILFFFSLNGNLSFNGNEKPLKGTLS